MRNEFVLFSILSSLLVVSIATFIWSPMWWAFTLLGPIILVGFYDMFQTKHAIMRNFPIFGRGRYVMEDLRPKLYQYFIESNTNGTPINRINRSIVYQRAKNQLDTAPFGTQLNVYQNDYEWIGHSIAALDPKTLDHQPKVIIGNKDCKQPYTCSLFNISAMSYGSLSKNAIMALNGGAKIGDFAHNTGEGGISEYHLKYNGDLIFQFGTGYFGVRDAQGRFSESLFEQKAALSSVKMIEIKLSQGAKPGHGGILPGEKNTLEIAKIRNVKAGTTIISPPFHSAFSSPSELIQFVKRLRELSNGKPIGIKLCIGQKCEFLALCKAMILADCYPDFLAIDGGEGGTGAAPLEFTNHVGMPYREAIMFAHDTLIGFNIRHHVRLFASGKIITAMDIYRALALGADVCYSARGMMLALGCIQALECNLNNCPTGVTSQRPELVAGLSVTDKKVRVANYHKDTIEAFVELLAASGTSDHTKLNRHLIHKRDDKGFAKSYAELYPYILKGCLLEERSIPVDYDKHMALANPHSFQPRFIEVY